MSNKKRLEEYLNYLGDAQPHHGLILFHLRTFADWLDKQAASEQSVQVDLLTEPVNYCNPINGVHAPFCTGHK